MLNLTMYDKILTLSLYTDGTDTGCW